MTTQADHRPDHQSGLLKRGRRLLWGLTTILAFAAFLAWIALGVGLYLGVQSSTRLVLALAAAVATEALFWVIAATLGVSVMEARKGLWRFLSRSGRP